MTETPIATTDGVSPRRDRMWGWTAGVAAAAVGVGSAAVAIFVEGANAYQSSPYPPFFTKRQLLAYDVFLVLVVAVGALFGVAALGLARRSRFPRRAARDDPDAPRVGSRLHPIDRGHPRHLALGVTAREHAQVIRTLPRRARRGPRGSASRPVVFARYSRRSSRRGLMSAGTSPDLQGTHSTRNRPS